MALRIKIIKRIIKLIKTIYDLGYCLAKIREIQSQFIKRRKYFSQIEFIKSKIRM